MQIAIEDVQNMLDRLPKDSTVEDVQYHLYVLEQVQKGRDSVKNDGAIPQAEIEKRLQKWIIE